MRDDGTLTIEDLGPCPYCGGLVGKRRILLASSPRQGDIYRTQLCCKGTCEKDLYITMDTDTRAFRIFVTPEVGPK